MKGVLSVLVLGGILAGDVPGQSIAASIHGVVEDATGAAVTGAALTLTNLDEKSSVSGLSLQDGAYQFLNLNPGRYQVVVEHDGFASARTPEMLVGARETRRADFVLNVARAAASILVSASIPPTNTENGTIADSKNFEEIARLPINWRGSGAGPLNTIAAVPGVQRDSIGRISLSGGLPAQAEVSIDGISTQNVRYNVPNFGLTPSTEMVREFRVSSAGTGAAAGQMGDITLVSRGGSNELHGSLFWYHQNAALDAKTYGAPVKQRKVYNAFGASLGGPVYLPGLYDGRKRTFFFADYEGNINPGSGLFQVSVPTMDMRQGVLDGVPGPPAVDPSTNAPFPGNRIPLTSINPVARRLLDRYYPLPNFDSGSTVANRRVLLRNDTETRGYDTRVDQVIGANQRAFLRWSSKRSDQRTSYNLLPQGTAKVPYDSLVASHQWLPAPGLSNEFRFGFSLYSYADQFPIRGRDAVADLGLVGLDLRNAGGLSGFPFFNFSDGTGFYPIGTGRPSRDRSSTYQYSDNLSWASGAHTFKFGADVRRLAYQTTLHMGFPADDFGGFVFQSGAFSGNAFADLLLGLPFRSQYAVVGPNIKQFSTHAAFFAQDTWRIHRRLAVEFGLRWEVHPAMREASGNITNFDHSTGDVIIPDGALAPSPTFLQSIHACTADSAPEPCTKVLTTSEVGLPQGLRKTYYGNWNPRLGFAYLLQEDGRTVVRGSFGVYTQTMLGQLAYAMTGVHTSDARTYSNQDAQGKPLFVLPNVAPTGTPVLDEGTQNFLIGTDPDLRDPRSLQWTFTLERTLPWNTFVRATYIGIQSVGMPATVDFNQVPASPEPFTPSRRPFPQWLRLLSVENVGFANYQGLQLEGTRRFSNGLYFQASYTLSKNLGAIASPGRPYLPPELWDGNSVTDRFNTRYDRGNLYGSRRHRLLITGLFPLPFGRGRAFGNRWSPLADAFLGGWELSTVSMLQSGAFQTPSMSRGRDQSNTDLANRFVLARPDRIGNGNLSNPSHDMYYDISAFVPPPEGAARFGNAGTGILEGPGTIAIAAGLAKSFRLTESAKLRFEVTFTNLPNHPNFLEPSVNIDDPAFGRLTRTQSAENAGNRTGQAGVRIDF